MIVTWIVIAVCAVVGFLVGRSPDPYTAAARYGALLPNRVKRGEYWRLLTSGFVHIQLLHLLVNLYSMYNLGSLEPVFGHALFALILLASIVGGSLLSVFLGRDDTVMTVGLSGGLYGLLAAYMVKLFKLGMLGMPDVRMSVLRIALVNLAVNLIPNVSRLGHAGGFLTGFVISMFML